MKVGKLSIKDLKEIVLKNIRNNREEVISNPEVGGDCAMIQCKGDKIIYLSSDPITGATASLGKLSVNINANDIATAGVSPIGVMMTILAPEGTKKEELENIVKEAQNECDKLNLSILGGHTEITNSVNRIIISMTSIGIGERIDLEKEKIEENDCIVITKGIGIEGIGIIANEKSQELTEEFGIEFTERCKKYLEMTSVVRDGIVAREYSKGMHDATEGGVLGAIWEMCDLYKLGCIINGDDIKISEEAKKITSYYKIDPLRLISSGTMIIVTDKKNCNLLLEKLEKNGIYGCCIGKLTKETKKIIKYGERIETIEEPESDELYKVI